MLKVDKIKLLPQCPGSRTRPADRPTSAPDQPLKQLIIGLLDDEIELLPMTHAGAYTRWTRPALPLRVS